MADRTPAQIGKANRRNGRDAERKVRDHLRTWWPELDYTHAGGPSRQHADDRGDLAPLIDRDHDHWTVQVKGPRAQPDPGEVERWAAEAAAQADANGRGGLWVLVVRRPGCADVGRWWAVLEAGALFDLVGALNAEGGHERGTWLSFACSAGSSDLVTLPLRTWVALVAPEPAWLSEGEPF